MKDFLSSIRKKRQTGGVPFVPVVYEHGARLIQKTICETAQDPELMFESQMAAYELYRPDFISVGMDIYNVEAEALGARLDYHQSSLPALRDVLLDDADKLPQLSVPDPLASGRMPLFLSVVRRLVHALGPSVPVSGTITGPFTLAVILRGFESLVMDMLEEPALAHRLLTFTTTVAKRYGAAFAKSGAGVVINESWIAPPLLSPADASVFVGPYERQLISSLRSQGTPVISLISGGNSTPIASLLTNSGTDLLMADYQADRKHFLELSRARGVYLRACIEPKAVESGDAGLMERQAEQVLADCAEYDRFLFGCGIVSYDTDPKSVILLRDIANQGVI